MVHTEVVCPSSAHVVWSFHLLWLVRKIEKDCIIFVIITYANVYKNILQCCLLLLLLVVDIHDGDLEVKGEQLSCVGVCQLPSKGP